MARTSTAFVLSLELGNGPGWLPHRLSAALVRAITAGQLEDVDTAPSTRAVAENLQIARSVVVEAYEELIAAGFFAAQPGSATRVGQGAVAAARAGAFSSAMVSPAIAALPDGRFDNIQYNLQPGFPGTGLINARDWTRSWRSAAASSLSIGARLIAPKTLCRATPTSRKAARSLGFDCSWPITSGRAGGWWSIRTTYSFFPASTPPFAWSAGQ